MRTVPSFEWVLAGLTYSDRLAKDELLRTENENTFRASVLHQLLSGVAPEVVLANTRASEEWRLKHQPAPREPPAPPRRGQLRIVDGGFADDLGPTNPVFCHFGDLIALYLRDRTTALAQLDVIKAAGYRGPRLWLAVGGPWWDVHGTPFGPTITANFYDVVREILAELHGRDLQAIISQGDVNQLPDRGYHMRRLSVIVSGIGPEVAAIVDAGNEAWQTGEADPNSLAEMVTWFREVCPEPLLTLTSPQGETKAELDAYSIAPADVFDVHGFRGDEWQDKCRHAFSIAYGEDDPDKRPHLPLGVQSEPSGPGPLVSVTSHKEQLNDVTLAAMAAVSAMSRQAPTYMSSHGIVWKGPLESQPGFYSVPAVVAQLPADLSRWRRLCHGGERWRGTRVFAAHGQSRWDHAFSQDGRFMAIGYGPDPVNADPPERSYIGTLDLTLDPTVRIVVGDLN